MPVSPLHQKLVLEIAEYVSNKFANSKCRIVLDHDDEASSERPPTINGFLPDLFARISEPDLLIIGEAKRTSDIEGSVHTRKQFSAFIDYLQLHGGGEIVIATPWYCSADAEELVVSICRKKRAENVEVVSLSNLLLGYS